SKNFFSIFVPMAAQKRIVPPNQSPAAYHFFIKRVTAKIIVRTMTKRIFPISVKSIKSDVLFSVTFDWIFSMIFISKEFTQPLSKYTPKPTIPNNRRKRTPIEMNIIDCFFEYNIKPSYHINEY